MSYDKSQRYSEGRAAEPCQGYVAPPKVASGSCQRACAYVLNIVPPGISLPGTGTALEGAGSCWGFESCFHCQALSQSDREATSVCDFDWADVERDCQPSCRDVAKPGVKRCLKSRRVVSRWPFAWIIGLTVCWLKSLLRLMNYWFPNGAGSPIAPIFVVRRS